MAKSRPRRGSPLHLTGAFELFGQGYEIIKRNFEVFMVLFSVSALLALWDTLGRYVEDEKAQGWKDYLFNIGVGPDTGVFASGGVMLVIFFLYILTYLLLIIASLRSAQGIKISLGGLWRELVSHWLWLKLIVAFVLAGLATIIGFILLIIPGVILLWRLFLVPYVLIDQKTSIEESFRRSWRMSRGFAWPIYSVILVSILLSMTVLFPVLGPLIAFVLTSIYTIAPALRYQELKKISHAS